MIHDWKKIQTLLIVAELALLVLAVWNAAGCINCLTAGETAERK